MRYVFVVATALLAVATAAITIAFSPPAEPPMLSFVTHSATFARATAGALLTEVVLPDGALPIPAHDLAPSTSSDPFLLSDLAPETATAEWQIPNGIAQVTAFVTQHVPLGLHLENDPEDPQNTGNQISGSFTYWSNPTPTRGIEPQTTPFTRIFYALSSRGDGLHTTSLRLGVQVFWAPLRPAKEEVPPDTAVVTVTKFAYGPFRSTPTRTVRTVSSTNRVAIARFARAIRELPIQLHGVSPECFGPNITANTALYRYVISFSAASSTHAGLVVIDSDACNNIEVRSQRTIEPPLYGNMDRGNTVIQPLDIATAALFSPHVPLIFISG